MRIRIRNGRPVDPARKRDVSGDVYVADGRIAAVGKAPAGFTADLEIDAAGAWVIPGLVDLSARFREPGAGHKARIAGESAAAAAGGVTTVCCPPDTIPVIDTPAVVEWIHRHGADCGLTRIRALGAITHGLQGERLAEMNALKLAGCPAVSNACAPIPNSEVLRRALEYAATCDLTVFLYAEDHFLRNNGVVHEGAVSTRLGLPPIPATAETVAISRALQLAEHTGAKIHFCRLSCAPSTRMIAAAKATGLPVSADVAICNLHLTDDDVDAYNSNRHLIPPLRTGSDRDALRRAVADGTIDAVCSDHQPHDDDAKSAPFSLTEPGASTIEHLLPLMLRLVQDGVLDLRAAVDAVTRRPAAILGSGAGTLTVGAPADIAIVNGEQTLTVSPDSMRSAGRNTPFAGWRLPGRVTHTLLAGRVVFSA